MFTFSEFWKTGTSGKQRAGGLSATVACQPGPVLGKRLWKRIDAGLDGAGTKGRKQHRAAGE